MPKFSRLGAKTAAAATTLAVLGVATASSAFAAGSGYGPGVNPGSPAGGGFSTVVMSKTVPASGGTFSTTSGGDTYSFNVAPGTFAVPVQVTIEAPTDISAVHGVAGVEVLFDSKAGIPLPPASLSHPVTVTVASPAIKAGDKVDIYSNGRYVPYTGRAVVANGSATISLTSDPVFTVVPGPSETAVPTSTSTSSNTPGAATTSSNTPGATNAHTGKPFLGEELAAGAAALIGAGGVFEITRRRRRAA